MLTRPPISDEAMVSLLDEGYGIEALSVAFLPIGADPDSASFASPRTTERRTS